SSRPHRHNRNEPEVGPAGRWRQEQEEVDGDPHKADQRPQHQVRIGSAARPHVISKPARPNYSRGAKRHYVQPICYADCPYIRVEGPFEEGGNPCACGIGRERKQPKADIVQEERAPILKNVCENLSKRNGRSLCSAHDPARLANAEQKRSYRQSWKANDEE